MAAIRGQAVQAGQARRAGQVGLLILLLALFHGATVVWAQAPALPASAVVAAPAAVENSSTVRLLVGRSTIVDIGTPVTRVSLRFRISSRSKSLRRLKPSSVMCKEAR